MVTWGNSPEDALPITGRVPDPADASSDERRDAMRRTLAYMGLTPGQSLTALQLVGMGVALGATVIGQLRPATRATTSAPRERELHRV